MATSTGSRSDYNVNVNEHAAGYSLPREGESNKLLSLINRRDWDRAVAVARRSPAAARELCTIEGFYDGRFPSRVSALHLACALGPPPDVLQAVYNAHPAAVGAVESTYGRLPLHLAVLNGITTESLNLLLKLYPQGAKVQDVHGRLPIHYACKGRPGQMTTADPPAGPGPLDSPGGLAIEKNAVNLLRAYPDCVYVADFHGFLPLHVACRSALSRTIIRTLIRAAPDTILKKTAKGSTAIDCARNGKSGGSLADRQEIVGMLERCVEESGMAKTTMTTAATTSMAAAIRATGPSQRAVTSTRQEDE
jgi:hypothetical protein